MWTFNASDLINPYRTCKSDIRCAQQRSLFLQLDCIKNAKLSGLLEWGRQAAAAVTDGNGWEGWEAGSGWGSRRCSAQRHSLKDTKEIVTGSANSGNAQVILLEDSHGAGGNDWSRCRTGPPRFWLSSGNRLGTPDGLGWRWHGGPGCGLNPARLLLGLLSWCRCPGCGGPGLLLDRFNWTGDLEVFRSGHLHCTILPPLSVKDHCAKIVCFFKHTFKVCLSFLNCVLNHLRG